VKKDQTRGVSSHQIQIKYVIIFRNQVKGSVETKRQRRSDGDISIFSANLEEKVSTYKSLLHRWHSGRIKNNIEVSGLRHSTEILHTC